MTVVTNMHKTSYNMSWLWRCHDPSYTTLIKKQISFSSQFKDVILIECDDQKGICWRKYPLSFFLSLQLLHFLLIFLYFFFSDLSHSVLHFFIFHSFTCMLIFFLFITYIFFIFLFLHFWSCNFLTFSCIIFIFYSFICIYIIFFYCLLAFSSTCFFSISFSVLHFLHSFLTFS